MILPALIILAAAVLLAVLLILVWSILTGVVPMPSISEERQTIVRAVARCSGIQKLEELGSGWGGLAGTLAREYPAIQITGVEKSPVPLLISRFTALGRGNLNFQYDDINKRPLKDDTIYIAYLSGQGMKTLRRSFERDRPSRGILISLAFAMPGWSAVREERSQGPLGTKIYIYHF